MLPDLGGLLAALNAGDVRFIVIGAVAVAAHGHIRATQDLDVVPEPMHENLDRLGNTLVSLEARLAADDRRSIDPELRQALYAGRNLTLTTVLGDLDIVQRLPGIPSWRALFAESEQTTLAGTALSVCSRAHLIAMKRTRATACKTKPTSRRLRATAEIARPAAGQPHSQRSTARRGLNALHASCAARTAKAD